MTTAPLTRRAARAGSGQHRGQPARRRGRPAGRAQMTCGPGSPRSGTVWTSPTARSTSARYGRPGPYHPRGRGGPRQHPPAPGGTARHHRRPGKRTRLPRTRLERPGDHRHQTQGRERQRLLLLAQLAEAAATLLASPAIGLVRRCEEPGCRLLFLCAHPRRRWCSPATCGNRARVARYYQLHKENKTPEPLTAGRGDNHNGRGFSPAHLPGRSGSRNRTQAAKSSTASTTRSKRME